MVSKRPRITQRRKLGVSIWRGRVAGLDRVAREGLNKKEKLERSRILYIWGRAVQKWGMTDIMATWGRVTNVAEENWTRGEYERQ